MSQTSSFHGTVRECGLPRMPDATMDDRRRDQDIAAEAHDFIMELPRLRHHRGERACKLPAASASASPSPGAVLKDLACTSWTRRPRPWIQ
ncbi:MAG: hypothetical protein R3A10_00655 [Caldilineaceae bacterium]